MRKPTGKEVAAVTTWLVGAVGVIADTAGRADFWTNLIPEPARPYVPILYLAAFTVVLLILRWQTPKPRLILDYQTHRGFDPDAYDAYDTLKPLFLRNDGDETALSVKIDPATLPKGEVTFFVQSNHVIPTETANITAYSGQRIDNRLDTHLLALFDIETTIKTVHADRIEERLPVRIHYRDHDGRQYDDHFDVVFSIIGNQMQALRVEKR